MLISALWQGQRGTMQHSFCPVQMLLVTRWNEGTSTEWRLFVSACCASDRETLWKTVYD